ncbi:dihydrofolate reductase [Candidatus Nitrosacidococcus sp. I8]|uniref:dihydrofolate reductase n=1 Tax=Candidatus Nitrosacidococcus sp. I8 TaxID=2942908 RepID=UPI0022267944|nr:dihydrofolate reductase [Candidatus Nitrosacidococcus sp. I8]CAH9014312.1 IS1595 family transposase ISSsu9 [Candidatus Nitrosacidococcus sp. I8]
MAISLVVAMDNNRLIGNQNKLPWKLPADLKYFRKLTIERSVLMGRKTYESIGHPLEGRENIILTSDSRYIAKNCTIVNSLSEGLQFAQEKKLMVIGGASIYEQMLLYAQNIYLTHIHGEFHGDSWFPYIDWRQWKEFWKESHNSDDKNPYRYDFIKLVRLN